MVQQIGNTITRTDMVSATVLTSGYLPHGELVSTIRLCREAANYTCIGYSNGLVEIRSTNALGEKPLYEVTLEQSKVIKIIFNISSIFAFSKTNSEVCTSCTRMESSNHRSWVKMAMILFTSSKISSKRKFNKMLISGKLMTQT